MSIKQGDYLKKLRTDKGLSQEKLSDALGISRQSISKWEQGLSSPDIDNLKKLSVFFEVSVDSLVNGEADVSANEGKAELPDLSAFRATRETIIRKSDPLEKMQNSIEMPEPPARKGDNCEVLEQIDVAMPEDKPEKKSKSKRGWLFPAYPVLAIMAYCIIGTLFSPEGWYIGWTILLTIPLFYTGVIAYEKKKPVIFCYPVLVIMIFVLLGLTKSLWHPAWILFLTIPVYYIITAKMGKK